MDRSMKIRIIAIAGAATATLTLAGCKQDSKVSQYNNDAKTMSGNHKPAEVGYMPDGFANYATKCDRPGIRVYMLFHGDGSYGSITAIADPTCK